jgi:hypothetical protein
MIPYTDISLNDAIVEIGQSTGSEYEIGNLLFDFDVYGTDAYHSVDSFMNMSGFTGGNIYHYLQVESGVDLGSGVVQLDSYNYATEDYQSASALYYEIYDSGDNYLGGGTSSISSTAPLSGNSSLAYYSSGTPAYVKWSFSYSLSMTTVNL